jgi:hypothetical protein
MSKVNKLYSTKCWVKKCFCNVNFKILTFSSSPRPLFLFYHYLDTLLILGYIVRFYFIRMQCFQQEDLNKKYRIRVIYSGGV